VSEPDSHLAQGRLFWLRGKPRQAVRAWQRALESARRLRMSCQEGAALGALALALQPGDPERARLREEARLILQRQGAQYALRRLA
jgi:hypothetical protein